MDGAGPREMFQPPSRLDVIRIHRQGLPKARSRVLNAPKALERDPEVGQHEGARVLMAKIFLVVHPRTLEVSLLEQDEGEIAMHVGAVRIDLQRRTKLGGGLRELALLAEGEREEVLRDDPLGGRVRFAGQAAEVRPERDDGLVELTAVVHDQSDFVESSRLLGLDGAHVNERLVDAAFILQRAPEVELRPALWPA